MDPQTPGKHIHIAANSPSSSQENPNNPNKPKHPFNPLSDLKGHRISLVGKGGVGKTSLCVILCEFTGLPVIEESIRVAAKRFGIGNLAGLTRDERISLQFEALKVQYEREEFLDEYGFVSDRSVWDYYWYFVKLCDPSKRQEREYRELCERVYKRKNGIGYDLMIYVPPFSLEVEEDGFRLGDRFLIKEEEIARELRAISDYSVKKKGLSDRVTEILGIIPKKIRIRVQEKGES